MRVAATVFRGNYRGYDVAHGRNRASGARHHASRYPSAAVRGRGRTIEVTDRGRPLASTGAERRLVVGDLIEAGIVNPPPADPETFDWYAWSRCRRVGAGPTASELLEQDSRRIGPVTVPVPGLRRP